MKQYIVRVLVNNPVEVTYLVDAETEEEACENYAGFPVIYEEPTEIADRILESREAVDGK